MKVKIQQRQVYHKFAEIEIEIPNDVDEFDHSRLCQRQRSIYGLMILKIS